MLADNQKLLLKNRMEIIEMKNTLHELRVPWMGFTAGQTQLKRELMKQNIGQKKILKYRKTKNEKQNREKGIRDMWKWSNVV